MQKCFDFVTSSFFLCPVKTNVRDRAWGIWGELKSVTSNKEQTLRLSWCHGDMCIPVICVLFPHLHVKNTNPVSRIIMLIHIERMKLKQDDLR